MALFSRLSLPVAMILSCSSFTAQFAVAADQLTVNGQFKEKSGKGPNLSGFDCLAPQGDGTRLCLLVDDELKSVQFASLEGMELVVREELKIFGEDWPVIGKPPGEMLGLPGLHCSLGFDNGEMDGEAVAHVDRTFYVVGSHGCSKSGKYRPQTFFLARVTMSDSGKVENVTISYRLGEAIAGNAALAESFGRNLPRNKNADPKKEADLPPSGLGTSIEAMAATEDKLILGFRSPAESQAILLEVPLAGLFENDVALPSSAARQIALGEKIGFRDLELLPDGNFLALVGPDRETRPDEPYALQRISSSFAATGASLKVPVDGDGSPEAIEVLGTVSDGGSRVAVLSDGKPNGGPIVMDIAR